MDMIAGNHVGKHIHWIAPRHFMQTQKVVVPVFAELQQKVPAVATVSQVIARRSRLISLAPSHNA